MHKLNPREVRYFDNLIFKQQFFHIAFKKQSKQEEHTPFTAFPEEFIAPAKIKNNWVLKQRWTIYFTEFGRKWYSIPLVLISNCRDEGN